MLKNKPFAAPPVIAVGLAALTLAGCSTYGAGYGYRAPYGYSRGAVLSTPYAYDQGYRDRSGHAWSRGYSRGHNGFAHLGGRRH